MFFEGVDGDGKPAKGLLVRLTYCSKCNQPLSRGLLEPHIVIATNSLAMTKSGCCNVSTISVLLISNPEQWEAELMPALSLKTRLKSEWRMKTWTKGDNEIQVEYGIGGEIPPKTKKKSP